MAVTVLGGFFEQNGGSYASIAARSTTIRKAAMVIDKMKSNRAKMVALDGVVAGSNATEQWKRVANNPIANDELAGARTIETYQQLNGNTVAGDVTFINAHILSYGGLDTAVAVANLDGNPLGTR